MALTTCNLFRSVRKDEYPDGVVVDGKAVAGVLYPDLEPKLITGGRNMGKYRPADLTPYSHDAKSVVDPGGGTSLFDKEAVFGTKHWWCFKIPSGTEIPASLKIRETGYNDTYDANHWQVEPAMLRLPVVAYKQALDNLARAAVVKAVEDAKL